VLEINPNYADALTFKGDQLIGHNQTKEGLAYIDKVLEMEPNHIDAKGSALSMLKNYYDAFTYFSKVLDINPEYFIAQTNLESTAAAIGYEPLDGYMEVKVHNKQGLLAAHLYIPDLGTLKHENSQNFINEWPVTNTVTRNGTDYEVLQYTRDSDVNIYNIRGGSIHYGLKYIHSPDVWYVYANYYQYFVEKGDKITFVYTAFRPLV